MIKKKYREFQAKKIADESDKITFDISDYKFEEAFLRYNKLIRKYKSFKLEKKLEFNILKLYFLFIFSKHKEFFEIFEDVLLSIDKNTSYRVKYKQYYKGFIYNLKMIVYLLNDEIKKAEIEKDNSLNALDVKMSNDEFEVFGYSYPILDENSIKEFFQNNKNYDNVSKEKKEFVISYLKEITDEIKKEYKCI